MVNLIGNACKFTDAGDVVVSIIPVSESTNLDLRKLNRKERERKGEAEKELPSDQIMMEFSVSDKGGGISANDQRLLFKTFSKVCVFILLSYFILFMLTFSYYLVVVILFTVNVTVGCFAEMGWHWLRYFYFIIINIGIIINVM